METPPSDQKRHIRQAFADLVFGLALFAIFVLLGVFGVKQASSQTGAPELIVQSAPVLNDQSDETAGHILLPLGGQT